MRTTPQPPGVPGNPAPQAFLRLAISDHDAARGPLRGRLAGLRIALRTMVDPSLRACALVRLTVMVPRPLAFLPRNVLMALHHCDLGFPTTIGPRLRLPEPTGIVIGRIDVGADVTIHAGVTLGSASLDRDERLLVIGDGTTIGTGTTVILNGTVPPGTTIGPDRFVGRADLAALAESQVAA